MPSFPELPCEAVVAIHLPHRVDRLETMAMWPFEATETLGVRGGVDALQPSWWTAGPGAWGCRCSHVKALTAACTRRWDPVMVVEDDAIFHHDFSDELTRFLAEVPDDWDALWLGGQHMLPPVRCNPHVVRCTATMRTHAYVVRGPAVGDLLLRFRQAQGSLDTVALEAFDRHWNVYAPDPMLVGQSAGYSDISGSWQPAAWWR